jgi:hypothetical protein
MRRLLCGVLAAGLLWLLAVEAQADDTAKAIIAKAIQAHGGAEKLAKLRVRREKTKITTESDGQPVPLSDDTLVQHPDRWRLTSEAERQGRRYTSIFVANGDRGWMNLGRQTMEWKGARKELLHRDYVLTLTPLLKDQGFTLSALGEVKVNDRPALGVKVSAPDYLDMDLYFDKETGLLVKSGSRGQSSVEDVYSDYKETDGLKWPMKSVRYRNGNRVGEKEITELKFLDKIDDGEFAKP